jgi:hypothetical protein
VLLCILLPFTKGIDLVFRSGSCLLGGKFDIGLAECNTLASHHLEDDELSLPFAFPVHLMLREGNIFQFVLDLSLIDPAANIIIGIPPVQF